MKTNEELFGFLDTLVSELLLLNRDDANDAANRIRSAASVSSVGTEILMALRKELIDLSNSNIFLRAPTRNRLIEAIVGINTELSR